MSNNEIREDFMRTVTFFLFSASLALAGGAPIDAKAGETFSLATGSGGFSKACRQGDICDPYATHHPYRCFEFEAATVKQPRQTLEPFGQANMRVSMLQDFSVQWRNKCASVIKQIYIHVKFFNAKWERIGVALFGGTHISPNEKLHTLVAVPAHLVGRAKHVAIQRITAEVTE